MTGPPSKPAPGRPVRLGVIGLGVIGQRHVAACAGARAAGFPCELVAVCDPDPARRTGRADAAGNIDQGRPAGPIFDTETVRGYAAPADLLADPAVDLVSVCSYTETHVELALAALAAGKHVLVEKPVAIRAADARRLADAAAAAPHLVCMPAMAMRFWPGWSWLRDRVRDGSLGRVTSATFARMGSRPAWGGGFYADESRSGGLLFDLHVHDADFVSWCFGPPEAVTVCGGPAHLAAFYHYARGPAFVCAEGAWDLQPGAGFRMRYVVNFEGATAEFVLERDPPLVVHRGGGAEVIPCGPLTGYDLEMRHAVELITSGSGPPRATTAEAAAVTRLLEIERDSLSAGTRMPVR